jgi:hypothetical protein
MHDIFDGVWSIPPRKQIGFAHVRTKIEEFLRAAVASERYEILRGLGANRAVVCRRSFNAFCALDTAVGADRCTGALPAMHNRNAGGLLVTTAIASGILISLLPVGVAAHDRQTYHVEFYSHWVTREGISCCSAKDCRPIDDKNVRVLRQGVEVYVEGDGLRSHLRRSAPMHLTCTATSVASADRSSASSLAQVLKCACRRHVL